MSNIKNIPFDKIRDWIKTENAAGRPMSEIVAELATRDDVTILSGKDSIEKRHQLLVNALLKTTS
ncbi:hypothetical protein C7H19_02105 [Aphanothece hegewaldii CCALA 016]|uniref:Uncharacterized protein n=1 Tax=Aphanothece hegewaldii CCALA 016 TaxID=2107694 RepID=A0A2T1M2B4_9CHRO|nr:hypothetical protein [Aphanothece hegewaldii]PSF38872.1 hypothetical protein C7H19_02105 [Aphanothece hegewaldii CCALA 016]